MRAAVLLASVCAACVTSVDDRPPVAALAELRAPDASITGRFELLGGADVASASARTMSAYHVRLPDDAPRRARLFYGASLDGSLAYTCASEAPPLFFADLQTIRRVGGETHFVLAQVPVGDRAVDVDVGTLPVAVNLDQRSSQSVIGKLVVISGPDRDDGQPGARLACGSFVVADPGATSDP